MIYQNEVGPLWITFLLLNRVTVFLNSNVSPSNENMYTYLIKFYSLFFLIDNLLRRETIPSEAYTETLTNFRARIRRVRPNLPIDNVLLLHDNARQHTNIRTRETIASFGWTTLLHPPYSPDLVPSDYHLFILMKKGLRGLHYVSDEEVKTAVMKWLKDASHNECSGYDIKQSDSQAPVLELWGMGSTLHCHCSHVHSVPEW